MCLRFLLCYIHVEGGTLLFYKIVLFAHIIGALSLFIGVAGIVMGMYGMRKAQTIKQFREWSWLATTTDKAMPFIALLIIVPGSYLVFTAWGWQTAWADVALGTFVSIVALGPIFIGPRLARLEKTAKGAVQDADIPAELRVYILDPLLWTTVSIFATVTSGIVFLMTVKPDIVGALITIGLCILLGFVLALPLRTVKRTRELEMRPSTLEPEAIR
jgi:hypothetical protein